MASSLDSWIAAVMSSRILCEILSKGLFKRPLSGYMVLLAIAATSVSEIYFSISPNF